VRAQSGPSGPGESPAAVHETGAAQAAEAVLDLNVAASPTSSRGSDCLPVEALEGGDDLLLGHGLADGRRQRAHERLGDRADQRRGGQLGVLARSSPAAMAWLSPAARR
jgi:hypothetical protein